MTARNYTVTHPGGGAAVRLPGGRFFMLRTASAAVNISLEGNAAAPVSFVAAPAGIMYGPIESPWRFLVLESTAAQTIEIFISDEAEVKLSQQVSVSGSVVTQEQPASSLADTANVAVPNAALTAIVAANLSRKRVTISFASNAAIGAATVFFRTAGGANNLMEVQPGVLYEFCGTYAISVRNDSGGALSAMVFEES